MHTNHLKTDDFCDVDNFPEAGFESSLRTLIEGDSAREVLGREVHRKAIYAGEAAVQMFDRWIVVPAGQKLAVLPGIEVHISRGDVQVRSRQATGALNRLAEVKLLAVGGRTNHRKPETLIEANAGAIAEHAESNLAVATQIGLVLDMLH